MCAQREDGEKVEQETLLKVFDSFDQLREPEASDELRSAHQNMLAGQQTSGDKTS
jgi:hypothetical protein